MQFLILKLSNEFKFLHCCPTIILALVILCKCVWNWSIFYILFEFVKDISNFLGIIFLNALSSDSVKIWHICDHLIVYIHRYLRHQYLTKHNIFLENKIIFNLHCVWHGINLDCIHWWCDTLSKVNDLLCKHQLCIRTMLHWIRNCNWNCLKQNNWTRQQ